VPATQMAELHLANLRTWRADEYARRSFDRRELDELQTTLERIQAVTDARGSGPSYVTAVTSAGAGSPSIISESAAPGGTMGKTFSVSLTLTSTMAGPPPCASARSIAASSSSAVSARSPRQPYASARRTRSGRPERAVAR